MTLQPSPTVHIPTVVMFSLILYYERSSAGSVTKPEIAVCTAWWRYRALLRGAGMTTLRGNLRHLENSVPLSYLLPQIIHKVTWYWTLNATEQSIVLLPAPPSFCSSKWKLIVISYTWIIMELLIIHCINSLDLQLH